MKKRILTVFLISALITIAGCGQETNNTDTATTQQAEQSATDTTIPETVPNTDSNLIVDAETSGSK